MKQCSNCGQQKPLAEFYRNNANPDGRRNECAECTKIRRKSVPVQSKTQRMQLDDDLPINRKITANLKKGVVPSRVEIDELVYQTAESLIHDHFSEWLFGNNDAYEAAVQKQICLPREKQILAKRLRTLADKMEGVN